MNPLINPLTDIALVYGLAVICSRVDWKGQTEDFRQVINRLFKHKTL